MGSRPRPALLWAAALAALAAAGGAAALWARARGRAASSAAASSAASGRPAAGSGGRRRGAASRGPAAAAAAAPVLVLGLDGAGKTSVLRALAAGRGGARGAAATEGSHAVSVGSARGRLEFLEIGGSESLRSYWSVYLPKVPLLVYVVDAADHARLPLAKQLLHQLLQEDSSLPVVVLANKQDLEGAYGITDIHDALALSDIGDERKMFLIGTHVTEDGSEISSSMRDAKELITQLVLEVQ